MARLLTIDEIKLLSDVFKDTLRYHSISCDINKRNIGGVGNSLTPAGRAYFSKLYYCDDFSKATDDPQWIFVHEMTHVWQWQHGRYPVDEAVGLFIKNKGDYAQAYPYGLTPGKELSDYNLEQQASIVADYWALHTKNLAPRDNNNPKATESDYAALIAQLQNSAAPTPWIQVPM